MNPIAERILVSLLVLGEDQLRQQLSLLQDEVGWVELRLDLAPAEFPLRSILTAFPRLRFVAAILLEKEGGYFVGTEQQRCATLLAAGHCGFSVVDLPLGTGPVVLPDSVRRLVSWHQPIHSPAVPAELALLYLQAAAEAGNAGIVKLVSWADFAEDALPAVALQQAAGQEIARLESQAGAHRAGLAETSAAPNSASRLIAFAQGPGGSASRVMSLLAGAAWIYSCWPGASTAAGQWDHRSLLEMLPPHANSQTAVMGVMGNPVEHSLSPFLWRTAFAQTSINAVYLRFPVIDAPAFFARAAACGISAISVTAPWKQAAAASANTPSASGAANFMQHQDGGWQGTNTDGLGAILTLENAGLKPASRILILGAGGAARGLAVEASERGYVVTVAARRAEQASLLCETLARSGRAVTATTLPSARQQDFDAVVQATTAGSFLQPGSPTPGQSPRAGALALDMVYHPLQTTWLVDAHTAGATTIPGTAMLIRQMLEQLRLATGLVVDFAVLEKALAKELQQRAAVVLIGARAAGKTSLGRALATRLGWQFLDADEELERRQQRSIAEWIGSDESGFRTAERALLPELLALPRHVVALGGGVVESSTSVARLQMAARVVFLDCPAETLLERQQQAPRPSLSSLPLAEEIEFLLIQRRPFYEKCADFTLSSVGSCEEIVEHIYFCPLLKLFPA